MNRMNHTVCPLCGAGDIRHALDTRDYSVSQQPFALWDCTACGLRFTQDAPGPADIGAFYQSEDYISHSDTRKGLINSIYHLARGYMLGSKRHMIAAAHPSRRLLDVGCGTGYFLHHLQEHGYEVAGVEVDDKARAFGQRQFGLDVYTPEEFLGGAFPGPFGIVTMWHVLEHVHDPKAYLARIAELLEPNGALVIAVPNFTSTDAAFYGPYWAAYDVPRHLWHFRPGTLIPLAEEAGFRLTGKKCLPLDPFYVALLSEKYKGSGLWGMVRAGVAGKWSTFRSWFRIDRSSSLVYVFRKG